MAKKTDNQTLRQIIDAIKKGDCAPVYILHGEEAYYLDLITENLEKYAIPDEDRDFNMDIFYGSDADIPYVLATAQQFPVMAKRKMVILKEAQGMKLAKSQLEKLAPYISKPNTTTIFVIVYNGEPFSTTSSLMKAAKEGRAVVFRSDVPRDYELETIVRDYCTSHKISIEEKALSLMIDYIGLPLSKFFGELRKLIMIKGNGKITADDVEKNIGISKDFNNFELVNAISSRNYPKALRIVNYYKNNPKTSQKTDPIRSMVSVLFNYFANLVAAHYSSDKSDASLMQMFGFKARVQLQGLKDGLRNYSAMKCVKAIHYLREYDTKSKGIESFQSETDLLNELIFKIFT